LFSKHKHFENIYIASLNHLFLSKKSKPIIQGLRAVPLNKSILLILSTHG